MILEMAMVTTLSMVAPSSRGMSSVADFVCQQHQDQRRHLGKSLSLGGDRSQIFQRLAELTEECSQPGWDGGDTPAISQDAYFNAYRVLESLPLGLPAPDIGAEPDGHLTLEWHRSPRRTLSVSVSPDGELHYAGLLGARKVYGTEPFFGELPAPILDLAEQILAG
jgi:hypothetical protein